MGQPISAKVVAATEGVFTVNAAYGEKTAKAEDVIFLTNGAKVVYHAEDTELVYVTYPDW